MKLAVCISGAISSKTKREFQNLEINKKIIKEACHPYFEVDYFLATWEDTVSKNLDFDFVYKQPVIHYHPVRDTEPFPTYKHIHYKERCSNESPRSGQHLTNTTLNRTKQILIHNYVMEEIKDKEYDIIIRLRFDAIMNSKIDWKKILLKSYWENKALGFAIRYNRWQDPHRLYDIPHIYNSKDKVFGDVGVKGSQDWNYNLNDHLIIHPQKIWDTERVNSLHENKKLQVAEWGWYQVLSQPFGDNHHSYYGGVTLERHYRYKI